MKKSSLFSNKQAGVVGWLCQWLGTSFNLGF